MLTFRVEGQLRLKLLLASMLALAAMLVAVAPANALLDSWPVGDGHEGAFADPGANGAINYVAPINTAAAAGTNTIKTAAGRAGAFNAAQTQFEAGRLVMIVQSTGYPSGSAASGDQVPIDLSTNVVGRFEIARISAITGTLAAGYTITLSENLASSYAASGAQIVAIPEFTTVSLAAGRQITASTWNGTSGGITALTANGAITMASATSAITASGAGFRGAAKPANATGTNCTEYDSTTRDGLKGEGLVIGAWSANTRGMGNRANGAGGGNCENAGGGGGGNGGMGGQGGLSYDAGSEQWPVGGLGGQSLVYSALDHAVFGGGGGSGDANNSNGGAGGAGGGFVFVRGASLSGGTITAVGGAGGNSVATGPSDGAGGGGAGGVVYARFAGAATCTSVDASGGAGGLDASTGGVHGPGGGGGGGYVYLQKGSGTCTSVSNAGARGYTVNGTAGNPRGAGPASTTDPSSIGENDVVAEALAAPTAGVTVPAANQTVAITSNFSGTSTPVSTIRIYIDGTYRDSVISDGTGAWTYTTAALPGGARTMYVIPVRLGIAGTPTATRNFTVDATPPLAPTISTPPGNLTTNNPTPTVSGSAEALSTITVYDGATQIGTTTTSAGGAWSLTLPALSYGNHVITAKATDTYGNVGPLSASRTITFDNVPAVITVASPADNAFLGTKTPTFTFSSNKAGSSTCQVDSGTQSACSSPWTVPGGAISTEGAHSVTLRWTDIAGNVTVLTRNFTVDTISPGVAIYSPNSDGAYVNSTRPVIGFTITDTNADGSECRVDGQPFASCVSPYTTPTLTDGSHTVQIKHTDKAGNVTTSSRTVIVDSTLPTVTISSPANSSFSGPSPTVNFAVNDTNPGTSYCQMDGGAENPCTTGNTWSPALSAGSHTLAIRHVDAAGNNGPSTSVSFIVDTTSPVVVVDWPPEDQIVTTTSPQINFTVTEANPSPTSSCVIDGGAPVACTSPWVGTSLSQGAHTLTVSHTDKAGNVGTSATRNFTVDSIAPNAPSIDSGPGTVTKLTGATFTFTAAESGGHLDCQLDGNGWLSPCTSPQTFAGLTLGEHSFFVRQVDDAGNIGQIGTYTWTIDQTPPPVPTISGPSGVSGAPVETITFYDAEQGVTFSCQLDGGAATDCNSLSYQTPTLADGPHTFTVIATDAAGNDSTPATLNWQTNLADFTIAITDAPSALSNVTAGNFKFSASVYGASFTCTLDSAPVSCPSSPYNYSGLADGPHSFSVYATQGAQQTSTLTRNWTIDATAPTLTVDVPANGGTTGGNVTTDFTAADAGGVATTCKLDLASPVSCSDGYALSNLSAGSHTLVVTASDPAGNQTVVSNTWTVDTVPPTTSFTQTPAAATNVAAATFAFTSNKLPSTYECSLDGGAWSACTSPTSVTVGEGAHTFQARATNMGNTDPAPATYSWIYDLTPPSAPSVTSGTTVLSGPTVTFRGSAEAGSFVQLYANTQPVAGSSATTAPNGNWDITTLSVPDGTYSVCFTATDAAGNESACSAPLITLIVDTQPPTVAISNPTAGELVNSSAITFSGTDSASTVRFECQAQDTDPGAETAPFEVCSPPTFVPELESGHEYTVTVRATDDLENLATTAVTFTYDNTPPDKPTITSPAQDTSTNASPIVVGGAAETGSTLTVYVDGVAQPNPVTPSGGVWSYSFSPDLAERPAPYSITAIAVDDAGNTSEASDPRQITVDRTNPAAPTITSPADGSGINNPTPAITGSAEANSTLQLTIDSTPVSVPVNSGGVWIYTPSVALTNGSHSLSAVSVDAAGNTSLPSATTNFTVDNAPPTVAISAPLGGAQIASTNVNVAFTATDNGSITLVCRLNGDVVAPCAAPSAALTSLSQGEQTFSVQATDVGGNVATASVTFTVDTIAPTTPVILAPGEGSFLSGSQALVSGTAEPNVTVNLTLSSGPSTSVQADALGEWSYAFASLADGPYSVTATAVDAAANSSATTTRNFALDNTPPAAVAIDSPANGDELASITTVSGHGAESGATVNVTVDGNTSSATLDGSGGWTATLPTPVTTDGTYVISVAQTDAAGNAGSSSSIVVKVDTTDPVVSISSPAPGAYSTTNIVSVSFSATDTSISLTIECNVNNGGWNGCGSPLTTPALGDGSNTVDVRATDRAGNVGSSSVTFTVDTVAPETQFSGALPGQVSGLDNNVAPSIGFSSEAGATFRCSIDNSAWLTCTSPRALAGLTDASHSFRVKAVDQAGNEDQTPATWTWTVDSTPPAKPVVTSPVGGSTLSDNTPDIGGTAEPASTVTVRIDGSAIGTATTAGDGSWSFTPSTAIPDGPHAITAIATDAAGNISPVSTAANVTVDAVDPSVTISDGPSTISKDANPLFEFDASETASKFECKLDAGPWTDCAVGDVPGLSGSESFSLSTQGAHVLRIRVTDLGSRVSENVPDVPAAAKWTWTFDSVAPAKPVVTGPAPLLNNNAPSVAGSAEASSSVEVFLDGSSLGTVAADSSTGAWSIPTGTLADGTYVVKAVATDSAGNTSADSDTRTFAIDTTPPPGAADLQAGSGQNGAKPVFLIGSSDSQATFACSIDGAAAEPCSSPYTPAQNLAPGAHTLVVTFTDLAGNSSQRTLDFTTTAAPVTPPPVETPDPAQCISKGVSIIDLAPFGKRVQLTGFARRTYVGQTVEVYYRANPKKPVAKTVVKADGYIDVSFKAPSKKLWKSKKTAYSLKIGAVKTAWTQLSRRLATLSVDYADGMLRVDGAATKPLYPKAKAVIQARLGCSGPWTTIGSAKFKSSGKFSARIAYRPTSSILFVRVSTVVGSKPKKPKKIKTKSLTIPVLTD